jgi:2-isopropylmalate synthase
MKKVIFYDTTLRDGEQAPGAAMEVHQKLTIAEELQSLGVDVIEAGFPAASEKDALAVTKIGEICKNTTVSAFARTTIHDIQIAIDAVRNSKNPRITLVMPSSDLHLFKKLRINYLEALQMLSTMVKFARNSCAEVEVIAEDSTRSNHEFLREIYKTSVNSGASFFTLADTVGYATPNDICKYFETLNHTELNSQKPILGIHCHNDLGLATINTITGIMNGANQAHCTINGIGERAGNAALEEVIMAITVRSDQFPFVHRIDTTKLWRLSQMVSNFTNFQLSPNKAIVGKNAFSHGSGLHQDGMLKDVNMYEILSPEKVGAPNRSLPITRHSGRKGLIDRLSKLNIELTSHEVDEIYTNLQDLIGEEKVLNDNDLIQYVSKIKSINPII